MSGSAESGCESSGGLYVIGTSRQESRRIDDQLRGRAGRQGDPGSTRFFLSLDDDLIERFGLRSRIPTRILPAELEGRIDHALVLREIDRSQRILEGESFDIRKRLWSYSTLIEEQRKLVGEWRQQTLEGQATSLLLEEAAPSRWSKIRARYGEATVREIERRLTLVAVDRCWSDHLAVLGRVRDELHFVVYDGRTPLVEFCRMAGELYHDLLESVEGEIVRTFEALEVSEDGFDWDGEGLRGPSATWTYLVHDNVVEDNTLLTLAMRPTFMLGAIVAWPVLFLWALYQHGLRWHRRRSLRKAEAGDSNSRET